MGAFKDPRAARDFELKLFPSCDGHPVAGPGHRPRVSQMKLRFLEAYYRINREYARLVAWRERRARSGATVTERALLEAIERAIVAREALEDRFAARGIVAMPVYWNGFAVDVRFKQPGSAASTANGPVVLSSATRVLTFRGPAGLRRRK
jgi:hypothetical protein